MNKLASVDTNENMTIVDVRMLAVHLRCILPTVPPSPNMSTAFAIINNSLLRKYRRPFAKKLSAILTRAPIIRYPYGIHAYTGYYNKEAY